MTFVDPYLDPAIGDLRNLLGAHSASELKHLEAQAVFANELDLANAGYQIIWDAVVGDENDRACAAAAERDDRGPLVAMFSRIIVPTNGSPVSKLSR
jgi:hypothetical protein